MAGRLIALAALTGCLALSYSAARLYRFETSYYEGIPIYQWDRWGQCFWFVGPAASAERYTNAIVGPVCK